MTWHLQPIPPIPPEIELAANESNLVIFVGAGVSRLVGCPSWDELANRALEQLATNELITFSDVQQLSLLDAKKRLSIAHQIAEAENYQFDYKALIEPTRNTDSKIYDYLSSIGCVYVTTNYDRLLDNPPIVIKNVTASEHGVSQIPPTRELICRPEQFRPSLLREPGSVIHLHGSIEDPKSMIVTTADYLNHYNNEQIVEFLCELFERNTVLFIGYGLEESEILEHILRKGRRGSSQSTKRRFLLQGFYSHQEKTFQHLYNFYSKSFGVYLCHFSLDHLDYKQLEKVIEEWSHKLKVGKPLLADDLSYIMEVTNESS